MASDWDFQLSVAGGEQGLDKSGALSVLGLIDDSTSA